MCILVVLFFVVLASAHEIYPEYGMHAGNGRPSFIVDNKTGDRYCKCGSTSTISDLTFKPAKTEGILRPTNSKCPGMTRRQQSVLVKSPSIVVNPENGQSYMVCPPPGQDALVYFPKRSMRIQQRLRRMEASPLMNIPSPESTLARMLISDAHVAPTQYTDEKLIKYLLGYLALQTGRPIPGFTEPNQVANSLVNQLEVKKDTATSKDFADMASALVDKIKHDQDLGFPTIPSPSSYQLPDKQSVSYSSSYEMPMQGQYGRPPAQQPQEVLGHSPQPQDVIVPYGKKPYYMQHI